MSPYDSHLAHQSMVFDEVRNSAYAKAIRGAVRPDSVVLDLGCGLGLLGLVAAQAGAKHVYMVDPSPMTQRAARVAKANGLGERVSCIQARVEDTELPEKVDLIISVMTGNFLLIEDLLPSLFFARDRYLKPAGNMIPDAADMRVCPAQFEQLHRRGVGQWSEPSQGIDVSTLRSLAANSVITRALKTDDYSLLADPQTIATFDFHTVADTALKAKVAFTIKHSGLAHGYIGWFRMRLGTQWLSTSPEKPRTHWSQALLPMDPPLAVSSGEQLSLNIQRPPRGEWTWLSRHGDEQRKHSSFFSRLLSQERLRLADDDYRPLLSKQGKLTAFVLQMAANGHSMGEITQAALEQFGDETDLSIEIERVLVQNIAGSGS